MSINANYHTHTDLCDGKSTPEEMVEYAISLGFTHLGFSGHMDFDVHMDFDEYVEKIKSVKEMNKGRIEILQGVELDNLYDPSYAQKVDYVIGSTHFLDVKYERPLSIDDTPEDVTLLCNEFYGGDPFELCKAYFELEAAIVDKFPCTFIGHFDLVTKFNHLLHFVDEEDPRYLNPAFEAMKYLVEKGIPFEINTRQARIGKLFPGGLLLKKLCEMGGEVIISSDAHVATELDCGFNLAVKEAKKTGFDHVNMLEMVNGKVSWKAVGI